MDNDYLNSNYRKLLEDLHRVILEGGKLSKTDIQMLNPLVLAYVGDSVYDTFVRTLLVSAGYGHVGKLHKMSIQFVKAKAQADILTDIMEKLSDEEQDIVRRGRNTKAATIPKNADISDYRYATGFEALIGYLYMKGQLDRLMEIIEMVMQVKLS
jgi:ribonuclease-3 family protein